MITTGSANIHLLIQIQKKRVKGKTVFLVRRALGIYSLNYSPVYHTAVTAIDAMLCRMNSAQLWHT